jgi:hypothetical protein
VQVRLGGFAGIAACAQQLTLQNSPILQDGLGIKGAFQKVVVIKDGTTETQTNFSPVKGDIVSPR